MRYFKQFYNKSEGNVAMMFGVVAAMLITGAAVAIDGSRLYSLRSSLQDISDAAALAGAYVADTDRENRERIAREAIEFHLASIGSSVKVEDIIIIFDDVTQTISVKIEVEQDLLLGGFVTQNSGQIQVATTVSYAIDNAQPVSMALVLDVSGSMNSSASGQARIDTLKLASADLFTSIQDAVSREDILFRQVRTGLRVYNARVQDENSVEMDYGWRRVLRRIEGLKASGGTNSSEALEQAYQMLSADTVQPDGLRKFIILMTDGDNNQPAFDTDTLEFCNMAKDNGVRMFTVAFDAPQNGQDLLEACASLPKAENFFDASNDEEFRAAFRLIGSEIGNLNTRISK